MRGFTNVVITIFLLVTLSLIIGAYYTILPSFFGDMDPFTKIMAILVGPAIFFGIIFLKKNEEEVLQIGRQFR